MNRATLPARRAAFALAVAVLSATAARAVNFTASYTDGSSWGESGLYAQGFNPYVNDGPDPGLAAGSTIYLNQFQFFKSGLADAAANIRLAIVSNYFLNLNEFTADPAVTPALVGLSNNTIASTAALATGDAITFQFSGLPLTYGIDNYYAAIFVNEGEGGVLTPVLVSTLRANYAETPPGSGVWLPVTNYGDPDPEFPVDYFLSCSNWINADEFGAYFATFGGYADANFVASFSSEPPSLTGDYNNDGRVDGDDLAVWTAGFGQSVNLAADGDGNGLVDGADLLLWQRHVGEGAFASGAAAAVPEPASAALAALVAAALAGARRRRAA